MADRDELDAVFKGFLKRGATEHHLRVLEASLRSSPELNRAMTSAVANERVVGLHFLPSHAPGSALAWYDPTSREIGFRRDLLDPQITRDSLDRVTHAFGHEISHAQQSKTVYAERQALIGEIWKVAESGARPRDYTALVERYDAFQRRNEARAELDGLNMLADRVRNETDTPFSIDKLARRSEALSACAERSAGGKYSLNPNLTFDPKTHSLPVTAQNIEAVAQCFYDLERTRDGYPESNKAEAIGLVADAEFRARKQDPDRSFHDVRIDLAKLDLDPATLQKQSIHLGPFRDGPFEFTDSGNKRVVEVQHTAGQPSGRPALSPDADPSQSQHRDHDLLEQIRAGVRGNADTLGRPDAQAVERISHSLLAACKDNRQMYPGRDYSLSANALDRVDHVVVGPAGHVFAIEGALHDPAHKRAAVSIQAAFDTPVEHSERRLQAAHQAIAQERESRALAQPPAQQDLAEALKSSR